MSYEGKKDEMIGRHVAEFQAELTLTKRMEGFFEKPAMPYGYPVQIYHPHHVVRIPKATKMVHFDHDKLSNDVPWVLGMEVVDSYTVGVYNPKRDKDKQSD